jgi:pimeloyl-ACP methyl ester carboxylesterase
MIKRRFIWGFAILFGLAVIANVSWSRFGKPIGDQVVHFEPAIKQCDQIGALKYCVYTASAGTSDDIIYHLHGRNLDENSWNDETYFTSMVQSQWQQRNVRPPRVVTISYGGTWLLARKGQRAASGLLEEFIAHLDVIEHKVGKPARRILLGESMGGLNVLIAGLSHPDRFAKVAALCPGVYSDSPFATFVVMKDGIKRTGASPKSAVSIYLMARKYFANESEWDQASPLKLIAKSNAKYPALYLSCGLYDHFGNFEGTQMLSNAAAAKGVNVEWHPIYGGHCASDAKSLARFLTSP